MTDNGDVTFRKMLREWPVQTSLFSFGPVVLAAAQLLNGFYFGSTLTYHALFGVVMVAFAVLVTRHHLVTFRIRQLENESQNF
ncbi:hypothetical protein [Halomicrococcus sp. NG-SE-24]|uniref:hypothetical protein n=1 Tax=Halomicrococcus sp. NG-SE-24 TaxID=3436928 RepID=UPI003D9832D5